MNVNIDKCSLSRGATIKTCISISQFVYILFCFIICSSFHNLTTCITNCPTMCVQSILNRGNDRLGYQVGSLNGVCDDYDACDYVDKVVGPHSDDLTIVQLNIRGIGSKVSRLKYMIDHSFENCEPDIILLSETWLTEQSPTISLPGYVFVHKPRKIKKGGGVGILIKQNIRYHTIEGIKFASTVYESLIVLLELLNGDKIVVGSIYRPPNIDALLYNTEYGNMLCSLKKQNAKSIILGMDHNMDLLHCDKHQKTEDFVQINLDHLMFPTITRPTRITKNTATLIDNIIITQNCCSSYESNVLIDDISDHLPSVCILKNAKVSRKKLITIKSRDTRKRNMDALKKSLDCTDWSELSKLKNVNDKAEWLHNKLVEKIDYYVPFRTHTINYKNLRREPWLTAGILHSIKHSKKLYSKSIRSDAKETEIKEYKEYNRLLQKLKRASKKNYYGCKCIEFKNNTKKLWKIINEVSGKSNNKDNLIDSLKVDNLHVYESQKIANTFGNYFATVGEKFANKIPKPNRNIEEYLAKIRQNENSLFMNLCTESEVLKLIGQLPRKASGGHDNISNILLKEIGPTILPVLVEIFNESIKNGIFPNTMKLAEVIPLYKGKERYIESHYRPISLLTTISKLLEKIVCKRVYDFLNKTGQINPSQYGFRAHHSCDNAINHLVGKVVKNLENKNDTVALFLDLSKAFDTLEHKIVLSKMSRYGIRGTTLQWFSDYLSNRKLRVRCKPTSVGHDVVSDTYDIQYGTPQGSCLGPLIFLIFCNDLSLHLEYMECLQFADDTTLLCSHKNPNYLAFCIDSDLRNIQDWFRANKLTLNVDKTVYMKFPCKTSKTHDLKLELNGVTIPRVRSTKFLGTWIDDLLSWKVHVSNILTKLNMKLGLMYRSKNFLNRHAMRILYFAQFQSVLTYSCMVWGPMLSEFRLNQLQKLQNRAIKQIVPEHDVLGSMKLLKILPVKKLIQLELLKLGYKVCNRTLPKPLETCITTDHNSQSTIKQHNYNTRLKHVPNLPNVVNTYRNSPLFDCVKQYQKLPISLQQETKFNKFVYHVKKLLANS